MKTIELQITYKYKIEVDETNEIVKEYESENDLLYHLANHQFSENLPVMEAIKVLEIELTEIS